MRKVIIVLTVALVLGLANWNIAQREQLIQDGRVVLLKLAPVDPRSLMQGDYMALQFALVNQAFGNRFAKAAADGYLVVQLDSKQVASFLRFDDAKPLAKNQVKLRFRTRQGQVKFASNAWFFEEGSAHIYERAQYGEFRVAKNGDMLLVGMRDENLNKLGPSVPAPIFPHKS